MTLSTIWTSIKLFFKGLSFCGKSKNHKCACKSSCCRDRSTLVIAYDERGSSDDSGSDIEITPSEIKIK